MNKRMKKIISVVATITVSLSAFLIGDIGSIKVNAINTEKKVKLGIDNVDEYSDIFEEKRVGLITNPSGMDSEFNSSIDILYEKTNLTTLFAAEHGIRGNAQAGDNVGNEVDEVTGLPVHSLYGSTKKPTPKMLENIDILAYDMQDVGARFYTYINTLAYAMEACAENGKTMVVFDRPNPVGGEQVQGNLLDPKYSSFVGMYPIIQRYGLTIGEYAKFINDEFNINCDLEIVEMTDWTRDMYYDETGLDTWVMPSPNMPTLDTALVYTGTCIFEGTNLSEGRGTTRPFELIGAPWINPLELANTLNDLKLPGAKFRGASFTPSFSKFGPVYDKNGNKTKNAELCGGVQLYVTDRDEFNSVKVGLAMLYTIRDMYPEDFEYLSNNFIDKLVGNSYVREGEYTLEELFEIVDKESNEFKEKIKKYYIYNDINEDNNHNNEVKVNFGIDNVDNYKEVFKGKKIGLITNPSGMDSEFNSSIDILYEKTNLTTLFAAEHGIRGNAQAGDNVGNEVDEVTGLPVHSLYGSTKKPTPEMLENIDILAYDMQDVGARFYTYINTLAYAMEACAENEKTMVVFDRPNPVAGDKVQGNILDTAYSSFVGMYPIVQRYGLTIGEYAQYINDKFNINCDLKIVKMSDWEREMYYDETGLNTWVMPSPNMPTLDTALVYTGTCIFEGTNLSEGRGTTRPFELIGAPWINPLELSDVLNDLKLPGVKFRSTSFTPQFSKYGPGYEGKAAQLCSGVQVYVTDRESFNSVKTGIAMLYTIRDMYPEDFEYLSNNFIDKLVGNSYVREGRYNIEELFKIIDNESLEFYNYADNYKIYGEAYENIEVQKANNIKASTDSNSSAISWESPKSTIGLIGYIIYKDGKEVAKVDGNTTSYKLEGLKKNTIYGFKVVSKYSNGEISKPISVNIRTKK